jgi:hypothetical protein
MGHRRLPLGRRRPRMGHGKPRLVNRKARMGHRSRGRARSSPGEGSFLARLGARRSREGAWQPREGTRNERERSPYDGLRRLLPPLRCLLPRLRRLLPWGGVNAAGAAVFPPVVSLPPPPPAVTPPLGRRQPFLGDNDPSRPCGVASLGCRGSSPGEEGTLASLRPPLPMESCRLPILRWALPWGGERAFRIAPIPPKATVFAAEVGAYPLELAVPPSSVFVNARRDSAGVHAPTLHLAWGGPSIGC